MIALRWVSTGPTGGPYPAMDANLELDPTTATAAGSRCAAATDHPITPTGAILDRIVFHRAARATAAPC